MSAMTRFRRDDTGTTIVVAMLIAALTVALGLIVIKSASLVNRDSGVDRQRAVAIAGAEAGIEAARATIASKADSGLVTELPCAWPSNGGTADVGAHPDKTRVRAVITYTLSDGSTACPVAYGQEPVSALVTSTATTNVLAGGATSAKRAMRAQLRFTPVIDVNGYAIFSNGSLEIPNGFEYKGAGTAVTRANLYVQGGAFRCVNFARVEGSVTVPNGQAELANDCEITGHLRTRGDIRMSDASIVRTDAYSSRGGLQQSNSASVGRNVTLAGTYTGDRTRVGGTIQESVTGLTDPTFQAFPVITWDEASWQSAGFTVVKVGTDCDRIKNEMLAVTSKTVFYGECRLEYKGNSANQQLKTDVALVLTQGFESSNVFEILSNDPATKRRFWIIDPVTSTPAQCPSGESGLSFSNQTTIWPSINVFLYSDCLIQAANLTTFVGQIYGADVQVVNEFKATFASTTPPGMTLVGNPNPRYDVELVHRHELQHP